MRALSDCRLGDYDFLAFGAGRGGLLALRPQKLASEDWEKTLIPKRGSRLRMLGLRCFMAT